MIGIVATGPAASVAPVPSPAVMALRPIDRATVRIVALHGVSSDQARGDRSGRVRMIAVPDVSHGSGVLVRGDGIVLTARHVVTNADVLAVLLPGASQALPARVLFVDRDHDVAFLAVPGTFTDFVELPATAPPLQMLQRVSASGYPLEAREHMPAATSGEVSRVNDDGRVQLAMALNPGNSGGPIIDAQGNLLGVVSQGADPTHGAQGITLIEPIQTVLNAAQGQLTAAPVEAFPADQVSAVQDVAQLVTDIVRAGAWGLMFDENVNRHLEQLSQRATTPPVRVLIAANLWNMVMIMLEDRAVAEVDQLPPDDQRRVTGMFQLMVSLCRQAQADDPTVRRHYPFAHDVLSAMDMIERHTCGGLGQACCMGNPCGPGLACSMNTFVCEAPHICQNDAACGPGNMCSSGACMARPTPSRVHFQLRLAGVVDDSPQASTFNGFTGGAGFIANVADFGSALMHVSPMLGLGADVGTWRSAVAAHVDASVGAQVSVGRSVRGVARVLYTPGWVYAENRSTFTPASYRLEALIHVGGIMAGLGWQEVQRGADTPLRLFSASVEFGW